LLAADTFGESRAASALRRCRPLHFHMEHRCVPTMNHDAEESRSSMARVDTIVREESAQLWINHDIVQSATIPHAPSYFD
jgi:N-acyl homoserine lactone hydrolase